ncbi:hypothetical protein BpHYR1_007465 [Brachionus plicatilis]|uniref:Uncharacterized protein n=1 Tax=Brachionus plicatilis TaxID=10195 RepID=A0A3M7Q5V6_BRAPC|nr:hypothetical protein BpHYR1_007465 [Brachionus plicatilis]
MNLIVTKLITFIVVLSIFVPNHVNCAKSLLESESQESQEKADLVYRIIRSYLMKQLNDIDQMKKQLEGQDEFVSKHKIYDRRQLKGQGLFERLKNKLDHDLNFYLFSEVQYKRIEQNDKNFVLYFYFPLNLTTPSASSKLYRKTRVAISLFVILHFYDKCKTVVFNISTNLE